MVDGIEMVADQIVSDDLDILVYLDIGMNALSQMLSGMRLASDPVRNMGASCNDWITINRLFFEFGPHGTI